MRKILCGQQKGGVGKSTLAGNLAVGLALRGARVIIMDTDKQQSCVKWASRRKIANLEPEIPFVSMMVDRGKDGHEKFLKTFEGLDASGKFDYCIIDAGGRDNRELRLSMIVADTLIAPCLPSQADVESLAEFDELVGEVMAGNPNLRGFTVINKANTGLNFASEIKDATDAIAELDYLDETKAVVTERPNFRKSWTQGESVFDFETVSAAKAKAEIEEIIEAL